MAKIGNVNPPLAVKYVILQVCSANEQLSERLENSPYNIFYQCEGKNFVECLNAFIVLYEAMNESLVI